MNEPDVLCPEYLFNVLTCSLKHTLLTSQNSTYFTFGNIRVLVYLSLRCFCNVPVSESACI